MSRLLAAIAESPAPFADADGVWSVVATATLGASLALATLGAFAGTALFAYSPTKLRRLSDRGGAVVDRLQRDEAEMLLCARAASVMGSGGTLLSAAFLGGPLPWAANVAIATVVLLSVVAALPPAIVATRAEGVVARTWPLLAALHAVLRWPLVRPLQVLARATLRVLRLPEEPTGDPDEVAEEILAAVADTDRSNALEEEERAWIRNIVDLGERQVSAIMTPRTHVVALAADLPLKDAVAKAIETGHSRYPVHDGTVDQIVGMFHAKDVLPLFDQGHEALLQRTVRDLMRKPLFVPETTGMIELLHQLKAAKVHMAVVLDEYGGTAGLITVEDLLEEIVGDIDDEYDIEQELPLRVVEADHIVEVSGRARVDEVNQKLDRVEVPEDDDYDTMAGWVCTRLGRVPVEGETFAIDGFEITVLQGDDRRVDRMRVRVLQPAGSGDGGLSG